MIHTLTISYGLTHNIPLYSHLRDTLYGLEKLNRGNSLCTRAFYARGLREIVLQEVIKDSVQYHAIDIRINPGVILTQNETIRLITNDDIPEIESRFNNIINDICGTNQLPTLTDWKVKRIDYAIDIVNEHVSDYVSLFKRCDWPDKCTVDDRPGSLYIKSGSYTISFYDKYAEQENTEEQPPEEARDILRLEIQCEKDKIQYIKKKQDFETKQLKYFLEPQLAKRNVLHYWDKTVGTGDYYKLLAAIQIINQSQCKTSMKSKLIQLLRDIDSAGSINAARQQTGTSVKTFKQHLKKLRELNINPVTIPASAQVNWLPSLRSQIEC